MKQSGPVFSEILLKKSNQRARQESMYVNVCLGFIRSEVELPEFGIWTLLFFLLDPVGFVYVSKGRYLALEQVGCRTVDSVSHPNEHKSLVGDPGQETGATSSC